MHGVRVCIECGTLNAKRGVVQSRAHNGCHCNARFKTHEECCAGKGCAQAALVLALKGQSEEGVEQKVGCRSSNSQGHSNRQFHTTSHNITQHHTTPHHTTPHYTTSQYHTDLCQKGFELREGMLIIHAVRLDALAWIPRGPEAVRAREADKEDGQPKHRHKGSREQCGKLEDKTRNAARDKTNKEDVYGEMRRANSKQV